MPLRPGEQPRQYGEFVGMEGCTQGRHPAHERLDAARRGSTRGAPGSWSDASCMDISVIA
jgi:hypothetical protein